ncbi:efflux RND transporter periplasmic adaptor subunit [Pelovirga terrestris]|uniref:Efflux RND transporter periplasmic adaptor subunit n=1 Tax=Pelovirga terrestris TaxID=2771352 RepID=A0A8J6QX42_9BACT|nr:efflux RND transporter periplasmic adaptor subunit [Pelovirga terrestris]MBD1400503.1 efflux RND transporter periplasmic adaptor subunit [Pelovirga terrestris]
MTQDVTKKNDVKRWLPSVIGGLLLVGLILYVGGFFRTGQIGPEDALAPDAARPLGEELVAARIVALPQYYEAVGTLQTRTTGRIESQVMGRVEQVAVRSGDLVGKGALLVKIDDRTLRARYQQAQQALNTAVAQKVQAEQAIEAARAEETRVLAEFERIRNFLAAQAATQQEMEAVEAQRGQAQALLAQALAALAATEAGIEGARQQIDEAAVALDYTRIVAPMAAQVVERLVDPGDLAMPGKVLLTLQGEEMLRLEALVPESLIQRLTLGQDVDLLIGERSVKGQVEEIMPSADPRTRSLVVKVTLADRRGLFPGMFGRLRVGLEARSAVLVPATAVVRIGQLELVQIAEEGGIKTLLVTTGARIADEVEILSGLTGNEQLVLRGIQP